MFNYINYDKNLTEVRTKRVFTNSIHFGSTWWLCAGSDSCAFILFEMGCKCRLNETPSAPDSRLIYEHFVKDWSVTNIKKQVVSKQSYQLFPQKDIRSCARQFQSFVFSVCH